MYYTVNPKGEKEMGEEMNVNNTKSVAENLIESFGLENSEGNNTIRVRLVKVGDVVTINAKKGMSVEELKSENGFDGDVKLSNKRGQILNDDYILDEDMDLYVSVPKDNG